jgi:protein-S-isoprenylcysteine O-methyltransferase Ste14
MPRLALLLNVLWFLVLFVFRTWLQWRRTGSGGIAGFSGRPGSLEWSAGLLVALGMLCALAAPLASLWGWPGGALLFAHPTLNRVGAAGVVLGTLATLAAQLTMGDSWRVGVDPSERTALVTGGLFGWVRNPIFTFMLLTGAGLALLLPNALALLAFALSALGIELHVRVVEEPHLLRTHGAAYRAYVARVGRFVPGIGRGDAA